ncbi:hypothetical protein CYK73_12655 [Clostridium perfringens]|nr:hypothetical protein CYK76_13690 [Clostridium perfringens]PWW98312.1 hypothetical protein CYK75_13565 [Clostridium perfringens]PWW99398.1 hypothetical protein CYK71_12410 [Clostridium perfringens]PWW99956.1 hypothetical protein CYK73_12655 [Clostridium perfringens]PWX42614.1 hypothetical protein CYK90_07045 [Clostridium perfringens]
MKWKNEHTKHSVKYRKINRYVMPRTCWENPVPAEKRTFLTVRELEIYTGLVRDLTMNIIKGEKFKDYIYIMQLQLQE